MESCEETGLKPLLETHSGGTFHTFGSCEGLGYRSSCKDNGESKKSTNGLKLMSAGSSFPSRLKPNREGNRNSRLRGAPLNSARFNAALLLTCLSSLCR